MLSFYFLKRLLEAFGLCFFVLMLLFTFITMVLHFHYLGSGDLAIAFLWGMVPVIANFVFPFATTLAVGITTQSLMGSSESIIVIYSKRFSRAIFSAVLLFSCIATIIYAFLIVEWAPEGYRQSTKKIEETVFSFFNDVKPKTLYEPMPGMLLHFKKKENDLLQKPLFKNIFFVIPDKEGNHHFFTAETGSIHNSTLTLNQGNMIIYGLRTNNRGSFKKAEFLLNNLQALKNTADNNPKYLCWHDFVNKLNSIMIRKEFYKRFMRIGLFFFLPLILFLWFFSRAGLNPSLIKATLVSSIFFLIYYLFIMLVSSKFILILT